MTRSKYYFASIFFFYLILLFGWSLFPSTNAEAIFRRRLGSAPGKRDASTSNIAGIRVSPKLRSDRRALTVNFADLDRATKVEYLLSYQNNGKPEGAKGTIRPDETGSTSRELLFGTCSKGVCTYHTGITNMRLVVTAKLKNGLTTIRRYRVKP